MRRTIVLLASLLVLATACTDRPAKPKADASDEAPQRVTAAAVKAVALERFPHCGSLESYLKKESKALAETLTTGMYGHHGDVIVDFAPARPLPAAMPLSRSAATTSSGAQMESSDSAGASAGIGSGGTADGPVPFSGTNIQEAGVDEPDTVKTDGRTMYVVHGDTIRAVAIDGGRPRLVGAYREKDMYDAQLLLAGDRLLVISGGHGGPIALGDAVRPGTPSSSSVPAPWRGSSRVVVLDVSDPAEIRAVKTLTLEGAIISSRLVDGTARIVMRTSGVAIDLAYPEGPGLAAQRTAERKNRAALAKLDLDDWLPRATITAPGEEAGTEDAAPIVPCDRVHRPQRFSGLEMVSVFSLDPKTAEPSEAATVVGAGEIVYASPTSMYVATQDWSQMRALQRGGRVAPGATLQTTIHRFDISKPDKPAYVSSGSVAGTILNQWSMSEHEGTLRIATTLEPWDGGTSESQVTVLRQRGKLLSRIGRVGGLGKTERIYGVRFVGDLAYVVTFRQVDPLYVIDLSNPARPRVRGELKISGYSAYLHPVHEGRLLGVGAEATEEGMRTGTQATVFDVADPDAPTAVDREVFPNAYTPLEHDHHAFLWWAPAALAVFPMTSSSEDGMSYRAEAVALKIAPSGEISVAGRLSHPQGDPQTEGPAEITRAVVVGDRIVTLSHRGLGVADLDTLEADGFLAWPRS